MTSESKISKLILGLIEKTRRNEIKWEKAKLTSNMNEFDEPIVDLLYKISIENAIFRIYKYKTKSYRDEYEWEWVDRVKLELIDDDENTLYEFPYDYSLVNLYDAVREQTSGINDIIDKIII